MRNEEDECDSSCVYTVASQSDVTSFLYAQEAKITGLSSTLSDNDDYDDESSIDGSFSTRFTENHLKLKKSYLSHSCFASISTSTLNKTNSVDDLTELKWLNSFKLKEFKDNKTNNQEIKETTTTTYQVISNTEDPISKLSNELKIYPNNKDSISYGVLIFLALYSKRNDKQTPWSLTLKQIYEYIQIHNKHTVDKRGWKNLLKQTLNIIPCFIKTKLDSNKSRSIWTIDSYYRPLLTKAYLTNLSLPVNKITSTNENDEKEISLNITDSSKSMVNNFPPKATVKTKALPRLYERLCEEKSDKADEDETESMNTIKHQQHLISERTMTDNINLCDLQASDLNDNQPPSIKSGEPYHTSTSGSIILPMATKCPAEIFSLLRHGKLDVFRQSVDVYHQDIIKMKNEHGQTVLHFFIIHAFPHLWVRLLLMRGCDPCCQDNDGHTAVHYAVERDDVEMLKALTFRFDSQIKLFPEEAVKAIHERCLKALSIRDKHGLTPFMISCQYESIKCFNYLIELKINDANLKDNYGDTCLYYAVARRNEMFVDKLIKECNADVNDGDKNRPSILDVLQFNREQQRPFDRTKDDSIEQILLANNAVNRRQIRRTFSKRQMSVDDNESTISNLACLSVDSIADPSIEIARNYARLALSYETKRDINNAHESYKLAMNSVPNNILDWADYAVPVATTHLVRGENQLAIDLLQQALTLRQRFEKDTEQIFRIKNLLAKYSKN
ncbi:unnamed protein product [Adineta steineri]|uniref:Fork-head domain-containing protein n=2 Tax=Adineta steineri TaxID=433720 RepID=A0A814I3V3_9BILA|nr:unnamed protein product [Adineta steineri]